MHVMIFAAGRGKRLRPLTDQTPKPLIQVGGEAIIIRLIGQLAAAGLTQLVINTAWLAGQLHQRLGDGSEWGASIQWSNEPQGALETGGGIVQALPWLSDPFIAVNSDVLTDYPFEALRIADADLAHLVLTQTPDYCHSGDFSCERLRLGNQGDVLYTFTGIGVYRHEMFDGLAVEQFSTVPLIRKYADLNRVSAEVYPGFWHDIGSVQRLDRAQAFDLTELFDTPKDSV